MKKIVTNKNFLKTISEPVSSVKEAEEIIEELKTVLLPLKHGVGLGAIQIGIPKQVAVIHHPTRSRGNWHYLINPEVIEQEEEFIFFREGCLSIPNFNSNVPRYRHFTIKNHVIDGDSFREEILYFYHQKGDQNDDGLLSIAVQHEIDHMNGKLISDHGGTVVKGVPIVKEDKVGRNDPCPCGSGKKYKKCCG